MKVYILQSLFLESREVLYFKQLSYEGAQNKWVAYTDMECSDNNENRTKYVKSKNSKTISENMKQNSANNPGNVARSQRWLTRR